MCDSSEVNVTLVAISALLLGYGVKLQEERKGRRRRTLWVKPWISRRNELGAYGGLLNEMAMTDRDYRRFMPMNTETFTALTENFVRT